MRIAIGVDHGGYDLKTTIIQTLQQLGHEVVDQGAFEYLPTDDYPDYAIAVGQAIQAGQAERGILVCGSGVGVVITANRLPGIRACLCHDTYTAAQGVQHDDMNVLCLGGRVIGSELARALVQAFVGASFDGGERFRRRVDKVSALERR
jgi:ribose 5-phosphate isomerase B